MSPQRLEALQHLVLPVGTKPAIQPSPNQHGRAVIVIYRCGVTAQQGAETIRPFLDEIERLSGSSVVAIDLDGRSASWLGFSPTTHVSSLETLTRTLSTVSPDIEEVLLTEEDVSFEIHREPCPDPGGQRFAP